MTARPEPDAVAGGEDPEWKKYVDESLAEKERRFQSVVSGQALRNSLDAAHSQMLAARLFLDVDGTDLALISLDSAIAHLEYAGCMVGTMEEWRKLPA